MIVKYLIHCFKLHKMCKKLQFLMSQNMSFVSNGKKEAGAQNLGQECHFQESINNKSHQTY